MNNEISTFDGLNDNPAWNRLENQLKWYSKNSAYNQKCYKVLKMAQLVLAASIPIIVLIDTSYTKFVAAICGALIAILEGFQQLFQFHTLWTEYRSTAENLKHEKYLFLSLSGPYRRFNQDEALLLLAERIEEHISKEHAKWFDTSKRAVPEVPQPAKNV